MEDYEKSCIIHEEYTPDDLRSLLEKSSIITPNSRIETKNLAAISVRPDENLIGNPLTEDQPERKEDSQDSSVSSNDLDDTISISSQKETNVVESIRDLAIQLLELVPALRQFYSYLHLAKPVHPVRVRGFHVSQAALPFVQSVADRFKDAEQRLVERLGEANWQRFQALRAQMEELKSIAVTQEETPKSIFMPQTLFHDSGIDSSIATGSLKAFSAASHSSFASSLDDGEQGTYRVLKTPPEVFDDVPFECQFCRRTMRNIRNRNHWKMHVFADLNAHICTFSECGEKLTTFATREKWAQHEFSNHRCTRIWSCPECHEKTFTAEAMSTHVYIHHQIIRASQISTILDAAVSIQPAAINDQKCPLCLNVPGVSRRNFVKHVARHLESIALAVLPREAEDDSDAHSVASNRSLEPAVLSQQSVVDSPEQATIKTNDVPTGSSDTAAIESRGETHSQITTNCRGRIRATGPPSPEHPAVSHLCSVFAPNIQSLTLHGATSSTNSYKGVS